jgi:RNA-binding protein 5/10
MAYNREWDRGKDDWQNDANAGWYGYGDGNGGGGGGRQRYREDEYGSGGGGSGDPKRRKFNDGVRYLCSLALKRHEFTSWTIGI